MTRSEPKAEEKARVRWPAPGEPWTMAENIRVLEHVERLWRRTPPGDREFVRLGITRIIAQLDLEERTR